jgi:hypothetical protein
MHVNRYPLRLFGKRNKKPRPERSEIPGLRKSVYKPSDKQSAINEEVYAGPTWIICPKEVHDPDMNKDMSHNWVKRELRDAFTVNFPQHTAMAHRGSEFTNKFYFNHPQLNMMTSLKIKDFLLEKEIKRVMVFTDGWEEDNYNDEYGKMYINPTGKIISEVPDKAAAEIPAGHTEVKLPIAYFLRDLISE